MTTIIVDLLLCALLCAVLIYAVVLNRHLLAFKASREDFKDLMETFSNAVDKASQGLVELKNASQRAQEQVDDHLKQAHNMCHELEFLIGRSEALVVDLEKRTKRAEDALHLKDENSSISSLQLNRKDDVYVTDPKPVKITHQGEKKLTKRQEFKWQKPKKDELKTQNIRQYDESTDCEIFKSLQNLR